MEPETEKPEETAGAPEGRVSPVDEDQIEEQPKDVSEEHTGIGDEGSSLQKEVVEMAPSGNPKSIVDRLDAQVVAGLVEMGFSEIKSEKAVHFTNNTGLELAATWLEEHAEDDDIDEPLSPKAAKPKLSKDEAMAKARELQNKIRDERIAREKKEAIERERMRIESTKVTLDHQRKLEEEERKRHIHHLQKDKLEHQKEKERQRELLKKEWEDRFGMPYDEAHPTRATTVGEEAESVSKKSGKDQVIHWCSRMRRQYKDTDKEGLLKCLSTIKVYVTNVLNNQTDEKYQRIKKENAAFRSRVAPYEGAIQLLNAGGFHDDGGEYYAISGCPDGFILSLVVKFVDQVIQQLH
eukprot:GHVS01018742.1.p1 GENE.GHVS01018742.1~~GHVS01018742.1.p1  ORF type:complete len:351 (+),score=48.33 GHVS01018742.1:123-1175(+)